MLFCLRYSMIFCLAGRKVDVRECQTLLRTPKPTNQPPNPEPKNQTSQNVEAVCRLYVAVLSQMAKK